MAEKEVLIKKKDGSFHQLPVSIAEKLVKSGEATIPGAKKVPVIDAPSEKKEIKKKEKETKKS